MLPFGEVLRAVLGQLPQVVFGPNFWLFWLIVALIWGQYSRVANTECKIFGRAVNDPAWATLTAIGQGLLGGIIGSLIMIGVGVSLSGAGISYLWPLAIALMLINPRLICFSYAGGLLSLTHLLVGWPKLSVPGLLALVAILHVIESVLIYFSGEQTATPVHAKTPSGTVGGYVLQRFWPIPVIILLMGITDGNITNGLIQMPDWWPLLKPDWELAQHPYAVYLMWPVVAALGYSDVALSLPPRAKAKRTSAHLLAFSLILLVLAILGSRYRLFAWLAALFAPLGHEWVARQGSASELRSVPHLIPPPYGFRVLDVLPRSPAKRAGLRPGDWVVAVEGSPLSGWSEWEALLAFGGERFRITVERAGHFVGLVATNFEEPFGVVPVPVPTDPHYVILDKETRLVRYIRRVWSQITRAGR
ncbi:MAG: PDZ domain-containing protein [Bacillota bacterium]